MNLFKRKFIGMFVALAVMVSFTGCSLLGGFDAAAYVGYELQSTYHNVHAQELVDMYTDGTTMEDLEAFSLENSMLEAEYYLYSNLGDYAAYLPQETFDRATEIFQNIYAKSKFTVIESNEINGNHHVSVELFPVDTAINGLTNDEYDAIFNSVFPTEETEITEENLDELANLLLDELEDYLPETGYLESQVLTIIIDVSDDGMEINPDSWADFDYEVIPW